MITVQFFSSGIWYNHVPGYKNKGPCMTHTSREKKMSASFIFRAHRDGLPDFTGYLVYDYASHARLATDSDSYSDLTQRRNDTELRRRFESRFKISTEPSF